MFHTELSQQIDLVIFESLVKLMAHGLSFLYKNLIRESWYKKLVHRTIQVSHMGNVADDRDNDLAVAATILLSALNDTIKR